MFVKRKKIILFITIFILVCCYFIPQMATEKAKIYIRTNKDNFEIGEDIELIVGIVDNKVAAYNFEIYFDTNKVNLISSSDSTSIKDGKLISVWYDETGGKKVKEKDLEKYVFKAKEKGVINFIVEGEFYDSSGELIETTFEKKEIKVGNEENIEEVIHEESVLQKEIKEEQGNSSIKNNANLQLMRISKEGLTPSFDPSIYEYNLTISNDVNDLEIVCKAENSKATVEIAGNNNLKEGLNNIEIKVTSEDNTQTKIYKIKVTKTADLESANTNLQTLAIENVFLNPEFDNNITNYTAEISNYIENLKILAVPENEKASVSISGGNNLKEGKNIIQILVTAPNGFTSKKVLIEIYKRNSNEEAEYEEEQSHLQEKLEEAYKIEKVSNEINQEQIFYNDEIEEIKNSIEIGTYIILVILIIVGIIIFIILKKKYKKDK